jgi:hypothetical protein
MVLSPNLSMSTGPCLNVDFRSTGSSIASRASWTFSKSDGFPMLIAISKPRA